MRTVDPAATDADAAGARARRVGSRRTTVLCAGLAAGSSVIPVVAPFLVGAAPFWLIVVALVVNAAGYSVLLSVHARPGRGRSAAVTAFVASVLGIMFFFWFLLAFLIWPCVYVLAWSLARRRGIGVLGVLVSIGVIIAGYIGIAGFFFTVSADVGTGPAVAGVFVLIWSMQFAANGVIWAEETLRDRVTTRTTTPARPATAPASRDS